MSAASSVSHSREVAYSVDEQTKMEARAICLGSPSTLLPITNFTDVCVEPTVNRRMERVQQGTGLSRSIVALIVAYEELPVPMTQEQFDTINKMITVMFNLFFRTGQISLQMVLGELTVPEKDTRALVEQVTPRVRGNLRQLAKMLQHTASTQLRLAPEISRLVEISSMRVLLPVVREFISATDRITTTFADAASQEHLATPFP